jgi:transcriptional regulator GlxA family with amidase domain
LSLPFVWQNSDRDWHYLNSAAVQNCTTAETKESRMSERPISRRTLLVGTTWMATATAVARYAAVATPVERLHAPADRIPVAFVLDEGATVIDFAGPWEVFQDAMVGSHPGFELFTVAPHKTIQTTGNTTPKETGLTLTVDHVLPDAPQPRVIVIGAQSGIEDPVKLDWIRHMAPRADVVMSVCTGASVLASTGLIDGMSATTHHDFYDNFEKSFPKVKLLRGRRFVDNGKFVSAGGLTSGIDASLHLVSRYFGETSAKDTSLYMEHNGNEWRSGMRS